MAGTLKTPRRGGLTETISIAAGAFINKTFEGRLIRCLAADGTLALLIDNTGNPMEFRLGISFACEPGEYFNSFTLKNESGSTVTVTIYYGWGELRDDRISLTGSLATSEVVPTGITTDAVNNLATGTSLDIAADATREMLVIYNDSAANTVWFRSQAGTTSAGTPIGPKQVLQIAFAGACRIRNNSGATCDIYVNKITV